MVFGVTSVTQSLNFLRCVGGHPITPVVNGGGFNDYPKSGNTYRRNGQPSTAKPLHGIVHWNGFDRPKRSG
eukprot:5586686-Pyramimonas_sp.AAC.1